jgi:prevent-host-death family protein
MDGERKAHAFVSPDGYRRADAAEALEQVFASLPGLFGGTEERIAPQGTRSLGSASTTELRGRIVVTMATRMGVRELRDHLTAALRRVRAGEAIEVTHHGRPVAVLSPLPADRLERLVATGQATAAQALARPLRRYPVTGEISAGEAIEVDRAER